jgi:hypothetical protein
MRTRRIVAISSIAAGVGVTAIASRARERAIESFYEQAAPEATVRETGGQRIRLPLVFHRAEAFYAIFPADIDRVGEFLASPELHPVRTVDGRASVGIAAFRYHEATFRMEDGRTGIVEPYAEVAIGPLVTRRRAPPMIELLPALGEWYGLGIDVVHLPVTTRQARDGGIELWGLPKFVADMDFEDALRERTVHLSEGGQPILTLSVLGGGRENLRRFPATMYGVLEGRLLAARTDRIAHTQQRFGGGGAHVELGSHPIADWLRAIDIDERPIVSVTEVESRFVMGSGRDVGTGRAHEPYPAPARERGRYTVRHPGTEAIAQYDNGHRGRRHPAAAEREIRAAAPA